jgi:hypothetical protein
MLAAGYIDDTTTRNSLISAVYAHATINQSDVFPLVYDSVSGKTISGRSRYAAWIYPIVFGLICTTSIKSRTRSYICPFSENVSGDLLALSSIQINEPPACNHA